MNKKIIYIAGIMLLIIAGALFTFNFGMLGSSMPIIPKEFNIIDSEDSQIIFNDGVNNFTLSKVQFSSVRDAVDNYTKFKNNQNQSVEETILNFSNTEVIRTSLVVNSSMYVNYWFENNGNIYLCHSNSIDNVNSNNAQKLDNSILILVSLNNQ